MNDTSENNPIGNLLRGKTALVIGAGSGIGAGIATVFAEAGARVMVADRHADASAAVAERLGPEHRSVAGDVAQADDCTAMAQATTNAFGRIDILVQNAGIFPWTLIEDIDPQEWDDVMAVNLKGCFLAGRACLPAMRAQGSGRMIFTSSVTGPRVTSPGHGHYSASKAGINGFIKAAGLEFARYAITVNGVEPGNILTEGMQAERSAGFIKAMTDSVPLGRLGNPRDVANACLFLASDLAAYITGTTILVDGGQMLPEGGNFAIDPA